MGVERRVNSQDIVTHMVEDGPFLNHYSYTTTTPYCYHLKRTSLPARWSQTATGVSITEEAITTATSTKQGKKLYYHADRWDWSTDTIRQ